ncbi:hypothetical protein ON010_g5022 [Phytophthora cinnamomi]|nr:hypothetical protein ON010_g5022 [Phytophthora cinnamomi]
MSVKLQPGIQAGSSKADAIQYLYRFHKRNLLSIRRITHKGRRKRSGKQVVAGEFGHSMRYKLETCSGVQEYAKHDNLFNMDQTSISVDMNPKTPITFQGERYVDVVQGMSENSFRTSVFLCVSATRVKLPPFIVLARVQGCKVEAEVHRNGLHKGDKVVLTKQKNAYCDDLKVPKMSTGRVQLEDTMPDVEFVPPGATMLAQPVDVAVMANIKHVIVRRGFMKAGLVPTMPRTRDRRFTVAQPPAPQLDADN